MIINYIGNFLNFIFKKLKIGDRVKLFGGYDEKESEWLNGKEAYYGEIVGFLPNQHKGKDAIVNLEEEIIFRGIKGKILILTLRYKEAFWTKAEIVHLHLFKSIPKENEWLNIGRSEWDKTHIESHAAYKIVEFRGPRIAPHEFRGHNVS